MGDQVEAEAENGDKIGAPGREREPSGGRSISDLIAESDGTRVWADQILGRPGMARLMAEMNLRRTREQVAEMIETRQFRETIAAASGITEMNKRIAEMVGTRQFRETIAA